MSSVPLIISRAQWLLKDAGAAWAGADYICEALSIVNDDIEQELQNLGLNFDTQVVILPGVPAETTDLSSYQQDGQPLAGLVLPIRVEWRLTGQGQEDWSEVPLLDVVADTDLGTGEPGAAVASDRASVESYEWRDGVLFVSPASVMVDMRVRFQCLPTVLNADSPNQPVRGIVNPLAYAVCEFIEFNRINAESPSSTKFKNLKTRALGTFRATQVQAQVRKHSRLGGRRSNPRNGGSGFTSPIVS